MELADGALSAGAANLLQAYGRFGASQDFAEAFVKEYVSESSILLNNAAKGFIKGNQFQLTVDDLASETRLRLRVHVSVYTVCLLMITRRLTL